MCDGGGELNEGEGRDGKGKGVRGLRTVGVEESRALHWRSVGVEH